MDTVVVVPGIMGSELNLDGERLWPPKFGLRPKVDNPERLLDPRVEVGDIIRKVVVVGFYEKLLDPLHKWGYREDTSGDKGQVVVFPYNWVKGIPETARLLAAKLAELSARSPKRPIVLLAHSMGGLICTYALECLTDGDLSWRKNVRLLVTFGTPFHGAPESLLNAFGVEGVTGIQGKDCEWLMADPRFPSAYQLFPHLAACSNWSTSPPLSVIGDYASLDATVELGGENLAAAKDFQTKLSRAIPHQGTRKFNFCGPKVKTVWAMSKAPSGGAEIVPSRSAAGDGTVPSWSGRQNHTVQFAPLGAKHSITFDDDGLLDVLKRLLIKPHVPQGPGGQGDPDVRPAPRTPSDQPRVSAAKNAVSSLHTTVDVEVFSPPTGGELILRWVPVGDVETLSGLKSYLLSNAAATSSTTVVSISDQLEFPTRLTVPRPSEPGMYGLVAWASDAELTLEDLDENEMDLVFVFEDESVGKLGGGAPQEEPLAAAGEMEIERGAEGNAQGAKDKKKEEEEQHHYLSEF